MDLLIQNEPKLKPCPFCGGEATVNYHPDGKWFFIECANIECDILVQGKWHTDMEEAKKEWNGRAYERKAD